LSQASYLAGIVGGMRVQVRTADGERAQAMLDDYRTSDGPADDDENAAEPRPLLKRNGWPSVRCGWRFSVSSCGRCPIPTRWPSALSALAARKLTGHARRQARVAAVISLLALVVFLVLLLSLLRLLHRPSGLPTPPESSYLNRSRNLQRPSSSGH